MKKFKNPILKIGVYILMSFFSLIIIISFGMPDFISRLNRDQNTAAIVNGQQITRLDLVRVIDDQLGDKKNEATPEIRRMFLDQLITKKLLAQFAGKEGIAVSDERIANLIRSFFSQEGSFREENYKGYLYQKQLSAQSFFDMIKEDVINAEFRLMVMFGTGASPEEVEFQNAVNSASFQMRYAFMSNADIQKKLGSTVTVTEKEIDEEMSRNKEQIADPKEMKADRERFRKRIIDRKIAGTKKTLISSLNEVASKGDTFEKAVSVMGVAVQTTDIFKPGGMIKDQGKDGKTLYLLSDSDVFKNDFAQMKIGSASRAIDTREGIYVFTPSKKDFSTTAPDEKASEILMKEVMSSKERHIESTLFMPYIEKSKVERFLNEE